MLTKGIIKSIDYTGNTCKVRMPLFENGNSESEVIAEATISTLPGAYNGFKENDVVLVGFENNEIDEPVVLGKLYLGVNEESKDGRGTINCDSIIAENGATIPITTKLTFDRNDSKYAQVQGSYENYESIKDIIDALQNQATVIGSTKAQLIDDGKSLGMRVSKVEDGLAVAEAELIVQEAQINTKVSKVDGTEEKSFGWNLRNNRWIVYSSANPSTELDKIKKFAIYDYETTDELDYIVINGQVDKTQALTAEEKNAIINNSLILSVNGSNYWQYGISTAALKTTTILANTIPILDANKNGLDVNGTIEAEDGHIGKFNIGQEHTCSELSGNKASGIYSDGYISRYEDDPTGKEGVYLGTDGIKLGENFSTNTQGDITAKSGRIGGFNIDANGLSNGELGDADFVGMSKGSTGSIDINGSGNIPGWAFISGTTFGVTNNGGIYADKGNIAGFSLSSNNLTVRSPNSDTKITGTVEVNGQTYTVGFNYKPSIVQITPTLVIRVGGSAYKVRYGNREIRFSCYVQLDDSDLAGIPSEQYNLAIKANIKVTAVYYTSAIWETTNTYTYTFNKTFSFSSTTKTNYASATVKVSGAEPLRTSLKSSYLNSYTMTNADDTSITYSNGQTLYTGSTLITPYVNTYGSIVPDTNNSAFIGSPSKKWAYLFCRNINASNLSIDNDIVADNIAGSSAIISSITAEGITTESIAIEDSTTISNDGYVEFRTRETGFDFYVYNSSDDSWSNPNWIKADGIYGQNHLSGSDRRLKNNINDLDTKYDKFFDSLRGRYYKLNNGSHNRDHIGFIAQEVEAALTDANLSTEDFAGVVNPQVNLNYKGDEADYHNFYALRYSEFIALNTDQIQKAKKRIAVLEEENTKLSATIKSLEERLSKLEQKE